jgi:hypothetical protein
MKWIRNPKRYMGIGILLTALAFMIMAFGTLDRVPRGFHILFLLSMAGAWVLSFLAEREERKRELESLSLKSTEQPRVGRR